MTPSWDQLLIDCRLATFAESASSSGCGDTNTSERAPLLTA